MSEQDYEYECQRAELLGLERPSREEVFKNLKPPPSPEDPLPPAQELTVETEELHRLSGGLEELNSLLASTRKKLGKCKIVTGIVGNLIRGRNLTGVTEKTSSEIIAEPQPATSELDEGQKPNETLETETGKEASSKQFRHDQTELKEQEVKRHLDKLDLLLSKAENAELSLADQNKQIKKILRK